MEIIIYFKKKKMFLFKKKNKIHKFLLISFFSFIKINIKKKKTIIYYYLEVK
jgi:hypothetical protein